MMVKFGLLLCYCAVDYACIGKPMNHGKVLPLAMLLFIWLCMHWWTNDGKVLPLAMLLCISMVMRALVNQWIMVKCCLLLCYYSFDYARIGKPMMVKLYWWRNRSKSIDATAAGCCMTVDMAMDSWFLWLKLVMDYDFRDGLWWWLAAQSIGKDSRDPL